MAGHAVVAAPPPRYLGGIIVGWQCSKVLRRWEKSFALLRLGVLASSWLRSTDFVLRTLGTSALHSPLPLSSSTSSPGPGLGGPFGQSCNGPNDPNWAKAAASAQAVGALVAAAVARMPAAVGVAARAPAVAAHHMAAPAAPKAPAKAPAKRKQNVDQAGNQKKKQQKNKKKK